MAIDMSKVSEVVPELFPVSPAGDATLTKVDVGGAPITAPKDAPAQALDPLASAGVELTRRVLWIVAVVLLIILGNLVYQEAVYGQSTREAFANTSLANRPAGSTLVTAEMLVAKKELLAAYAASSQATRDFWMQVSQMVLINVLLPVLTALLGYVFASKSNK